MHELAHTVALDSSPEAARIAHRRARDAALDARWRAALRDAYTSVAALVAAGYVEATAALALEAVAGRYQLRVPQYYARLFDRKNPARCPIRAQAVPHADEVAPPWPAWAAALSQQAFGREVPWMADAIGDVAHLAAPRLTHRYGNRALLHVTTACAVYCRFCFRKAHLNAGEAALYDGSLAPALAYLQAHPEIHELILTGGDPLSMTDAWLQRLLHGIAAIPHLRTLRVHSRMPVTLPARITPNLARLLGQSGLNVVLVAHFNHPREVTPAATRALARLRRRGVLLLNQAVLMAGINDHAAVLARLFAALYERGVMPYYLHHADWTPDTFHFRVPIHRGRRIMAALFGQVSGPALPRYVVDTPGGQGKVDLMDARVRRLHTARDRQLGGAIWELPLPTTRVAADAHQPKALYADFWRRKSGEKECDR